MRLYCLQSVCSISADRSDSIEAMDTAGLYADLLDELPEPRRTHSVAVGLKVAEHATRLAPALRADAIAAAFLHDIGYAPRFAATGFHPLDGASALSALGFPSGVCHLVATHSGAELEASERGIPATKFAAFVSPGMEPARDLLMWADLTTSPAGETVTIRDRLDEILSRYDAQDPVHRHVTRNRDQLVAAAERFYVGS